MFIKEATPSRSHWLCTADFAFSMNYILSFCFRRLFLLLRYNTQSTKYMLLKYTFLCFLYSQVCVTTYFQNISIISKDSHPFRDTPLHPCCPLWENTHVFSLYGFDNSGHFISMESNQIWTFISHFAHLA